jgi:predicted GNAT family acetyltransferase
VKAVVGLDERSADAVAAFREQGASRSEVKAYADDLLQARAEAIAETEMAEAFEEGKRQSWQQAAEDGDLPADTERYWKAFAGCCDACDELDGTSVGLDEPFELPDGTEIMGPPAHPHCACETHLAKGLREASAHILHAAVAAALVACGDPAAKAEYMRQYYLDHKQEAKPRERAAPVAPRSVGTRAAPRRKEPSERIPFVGGTPEYRREYARRRQERLRAERAAGVPQRPRVPREPAVPRERLDRESREQDRLERVRQQNEEMRARTQELAQEQAANQAALPPASSAAVGEPRWEGGPPTVDLFPPRPATNLPGQSAELQKANAAANSVSVRFNGRGLTAQEFSTQAATMHPRAAQLLHDQASIARSMFPDSQISVQLHTGKMASVSATTASGVRMTRHCQTRDDGTMEVEHAYFQIPREMQGKGYASRMMAESMEAYERNDISIVKVHANIDVGGHAWAKQGFEASHPDSFVQTMSRRATSRVSAARTQELAVGMRAAGKGAPAWLASQPEGKAILLGSDWNGRINLRTPSGKRIASEIKAKHKKVKP